jgi:iron complex transport system ATP-binding protein
MKNEYLIDIRDVSITRGGQTVLCGIDWCTLPGEHWFVMGNNGSGKTTLMEILMGYLWPQHGTVSVLGERYGQVYIQELRKRIGYVSPWVFEHTGPHIPVEDILASGMEGSVGYASDIPRNVRIQIERQLAFFGLHGFEKRHFGSLSSGQCLKVMLARSLIANPRVLILDEPFSLLDIGSRYAMYSFIQKISTDSDGPQLILVTHHLDDIQPAFSHGLILKNREVFKQGPRDEVLSTHTLSQAFDIPSESVHFRVLY